MSGVNPVEKKDSMGQLGNIAQLAKTAFDIKKGVASDEAPPPPPEQPDLSASSSSAAIDRRINKNGVV